MKNKTNTFQLGESYVTTIFLLAIVAAIIFYLFWTGEMSQVQTQLNG